MIGTAAARFHYVGENWLDMNYSRLKFWYDIAIDMYKAEKNAMNKK